MRSRKGGRGSPTPPVVVSISATVLAVAICLPLAYLVLRTLGTEGGVGKLLFRTRTLAVLGRTAGLVGAVTGISVILSLALAWLTVRTDLPLRRLWSVLTVLPLVIPSYVAGFVVVAALGPRGMLQQMLENLFGVERLPEIYGFPGATLTIVVVGYPYVLLTLQASLKNLNPALEEASQSLGRTRWQTFLGVTLPQLRPGIAAGALLVALYALSDFGAVSLLRYETFTWAIYLQYQTSFDRSMAAALSLVLVVMAVIILILEAHTRGKGQYYHTGTGGVRHASVVRLGKGRWLAFAFCGSVVLLTLIMPMAVLGYWLIQGISRGEPLGRIWAPTLNSVYVSGLASGVTAIAAIPIAILAVRYRSRLGILTERAAYIGFALPGIVVALALVFFGAHYARPLYQTIVLLVFAYMILFLPQALGATRAALLQINPAVEEAARSLGRKPLDVLVSVTFPLMRSGILAGAALVFFTAMKELPATLILSPIGFRTLATSTWSATSEAFLSRAAVPALLLVITSAAPMAFLTLKEPRT